MRTNVTICRKAKLTYVVIKSCRSVCDDERIVEVKSDSALLRAKGADREKPGNLEILDPQIPRPSCTPSLCIQLIQTLLLRVKFGDTGGTLVFVVLEFHGLCSSVHHLVLESNALY